MSVDLESGKEIRCFICLEPAPGVRSGLERWIGARRPEAPKLKWARPSSLHLTIKFCGEIPSGTVTAVAERLHQALARQTAFRLSLEDTGVFPPRGAPRVLWGGVKGDLQALQMLHARVEEAAADCGLPREKRPFSPHLTLARIRSLSDFPVSWRRTGPPGEASWGGWTVQEVIFMRSELRRDGPIYSPIERYSLRQNSGGA
jgi:2'-5' RNA ligase